MTDTSQIRELYHTVIADKYGNDYEFKRWFTSPRLRLDYAMTHTALAQQIADLSFKRCLEVGPGPGTWTRLLYRRNPAAQFDLFDISAEMKKQFELEMRSQPNVTYAVGTFPDVDIEAGAYDLFFSSRVFEYIEDKPAFVKKAFESLRPGGVGIINTKNPLMGLRRRRESRPQHSGQIDPRSFESLLRQAGFENIESFPVIIRTPIIDRFHLGLSERLFGRYVGRALAETPIFLVESYAIRFTRPA